MRNNILLLQISLILFLYSGLPGQVLQFERPFQNSELPINSINCLLQDKQGFIWIGTTDGLCRYDGKALVEFRYDPQDTSSLSNNLIIKLHEGPDGKIWIGTALGLNCYLPEEEKILRFIHKDTDAFDAENYILDLEIDRQGYVWYGTYNGLFRLDSKQGALVQFLHQQEQAGSIIDNLIWKIHQDQRGRLWIGTNNGISRYDNDSTFVFQNFHAQPQNPKGLKTKQVFDFAEQQNGTIWIGTDDGIYRVEESDTSLQFVQFNSKNGLSDSFIQCMDFKEDVLWIGTFEGGINVLEIPNTSAPSLKIQQYRANSDDPYSISLDRINTILHERSGTIWVGTSNNLNKAAPHTKKFEIFGSYNGDSGSLSHPIIKSILRDSKGNLWIGTFSGLNLLTAENFANKRFQFHHFLANPNLEGHISHNNIFGMQEDSQGYLWVSTFRGLNYIDLETVPEAPVFQQFFYEDGLPHNIIHNIKEISPDQYWVATYGKLSKMSFNRKNPAETEFLNYDMDDNRNDALVNATTYMVEQDRFGDYWIGTFSGLSRYIQEGDREYFDNYVNDLDDTQSLSNNSIRCLFKDSSGRLWVGTRAGLNLVLQDSRASRAWFKSYGIKDGLPNDAIQSIEEDDKGKLWIGTNKGLVVFDPDLAAQHQKPVRKIYTKADGLTSNGLVFRSSHKDQDGYLYFGSAGGLNYFKPEQLLSNSYTAPIVFTQLKVLNEVVKPQDNGILKRSISLSDSISLKYWQNVLEIQFASLDFNQPGKNQYRYLLEGFQEEWVELGTKNSVSYTNLSPGQYTLKVMGSNSDGQWNPKAAILHLQVLPPPWRTIWAYLLYFFTLSTLLYFFIRFRIRSRLRIVEEQARIEKARLEERALLRKKNAADFHDELGHRLTKISLFLELANRESRSGKNIQAYLEKIQGHASALSGGIRDLIWTLDPREDSLYQTLLRLEEFGNQLFEFTDTNFELIGLQEDWENIALAPDLRKHLILLFKEAMNNTLKYAGASKSSLHADLEGHLLRIIFQDNGKGVTPNKQSKGYGLQNMERRAKAIQAKYTFESQPEKGTQISLEINLKG